MSKNLSLYPQEIIEKKIYLIRGKKVMLDKNLAILYGVETRTLNQAVKRNIERFPQDFMFQLTKEEALNTALYENPLRSQFVILKRGRHLKYLPYTFTQEGVAMLSSVLKSKTAIQMNVQIMRAFTKLRELVATNDLIRQKIEELEKKFDKHDGQIKILFEAIRELLESPKPPKKKPIGFHVKY